jgi:hypothetical protein
MTLETPMYKHVEAKQSWRLSSRLTLVQDEGCACDLFKRVALEPIHRGIPVCLRTDVFTQNKR